MVYRKLVVNIVISVALLGCFGWHSHSSDAQDSGRPLSFQTNSSVVEPKWLDDGTTLAFTTYDDDADGVLMWYLYDVNTQLITQTNIYPMPASLANFDFDAVQVAVLFDEPLDISNIKTALFSPDQQYLAIISEIDDYRDRVNILPLVYLFPMPLTKTN